jgi:hypothetical protein
MSGSVVDHVDLLAETIDNWMQVLRATAQQTNQWLDELEGLDREMEPIQLLAAKMYVKYFLHLLNILVVGKSRNPCKLLSRFRVFKTR